MKSFLFLVISVAGTAFADNNILLSPNGKIEFTIHSNSPSIDINFDKRKVIEIPALGLITSRGEGIFSIDSISKPIVIKEEYEMIAGKRKFCSNNGTEQIIYMSDANNNLLNLRLRVYDDGVAFRYELENLNENTIDRELTTYKIPEGTKRWIQKWTEPYEEFFPLSTTGITDENHWGYPALISINDDIWCIITEANIERRQSASSLRNDSNAELYTVFVDENNLPQNGEWHSPWRTLIVGSLADVVESTLVTDLSNPSTIADPSWIKPGTVSWIYWAYNNGSRDYEIVKQYVDMGVELNLPYVLIDADWDKMGNGGTYDDMFDYISHINIRPLVWYNSSTAWTNGAGGPQFKLNAPEDREKEYKWLSDKGIAGVKVDFFSGDKQSTMDYCIDLLEDAAKYNLLVNFHGATVPRGWQRTYPNLLSTEGVYGAEWYNNGPTLTDRAAAHNATLPFTRNVIGPMDYTPVTFSDSQHPHITTHAHELALSVVFESALQHLADRPESYLSQPDEIKKFFTTLPTTWDNTLLLGGYPGEYVVMARQKGNEWYVAGLNGTDAQKTIDIDWSRIPNVAQLTSFTIEDSGNIEKPWKFSSSTGNAPNAMTCLPRGGFIIRLSPKDLIYKIP